MIVSEETKWNDLLTADSVDFNFKSTDRAGKYKELSNIVQSFKAHFASSITEDTKRYMQSSKPEYCVMKMCEYTKVQFQKLLCMRLDFNSGIKERFATYFSTFRLYHRFYKNLHSKIVHKSENMQEYWDTMGEEMVKAISETLNILEQLKYSLDKK